MAFDQKVSEIRTALAGLLRDLETSDARIDSFGKGLAGSVEKAKTINELAEAVRKFAQATGEVNNNAFTQVAQAAKVLEQTLTNINPTGITKTTVALEQQARVLQQIASLQNSITGVRQGAAPTSQTSAAQEIFRARQQIALDLIRQKAPQADDVKSLQLAADLAEGQASGRVRLGGGARLRTDTLSQEFEQVASQQNVNIRGVGHPLSQQNYQQQYAAEQESASLIQKINAEEEKRLAGLESLNLNRLDTTTVDADYKAAQVKLIEQKLREAAAEEKLILAEQEEAAARKKASEAKAASARAPYEQQLAGLSPAAQAIQNARNPGFAVGKGGDLLDEKGIARLEQQAKLYQQFNAEAQKLSGGKTKLSPEGFSAQSYLDLNNGITKVVGQAQTLDGTFINLNGHIGQNGKLVADLGTRYGGILDILGKNIAKVAEFAIATAAIYGSVRKLGDAFKTVVDTQDELVQISLAIKDLGENADKFQSQFLNQSVQAGVRTGQGFEESLQTGLSAFRITANVPNLQQRQQVAGRLTETELGTQSVFGLSKEQGIDSVGSIYRQIVDQGKPAAEAVDDVNTLLDKFVVASRNSGVVGKELVQTFAQLYGSAKDLGTTDNELVGLTAAFSQVSNKSPEETATSLKNLTERIYGAGGKDLADLGIAVREIDSKTGTARFRPLLAILKDAYVKSQESDAASLQVAQAIGSQRRAPEAKLLVQAVPEIERISAVSSNVDTKGGQFKQTLTELQQNYTQTVNRLSLIFDRFVQRILIDGGLLKDITKFISGLADVLEHLSDIKDPEIFRNIKDTLNVLGAAALAAAIGSLSFVKQLKLQFADLTSSIKLATIAQREFTASSSPINEFGGVGTASYGPQVKPAFSPESKAKLQSAALALGAVAIPVVFELQQEGATTEGLTSAGARIAGGIVGFMVGGPGGALIGQEIGKFISDSIDLPGIVGTSDKEKGKFAEGYAGLSSAEKESLSKVNLDQLQEFLKSKPAFEQDIGLGANSEFYKTTKNVQGIGGNPFSDEAQGQIRSKFDFDISKFGIDTETIRKVAAASPNSTPQEIIDFLKQLKDTNSEIRKKTDELAKTSFDVQSHRSEGEHGTASAYTFEPGSTGGVSDQGNLLFKTLDEEIKNIKDSADQSIAESQSRYSAPRGLSEFGPGGTQQQKLQQQYLGGQIDTKQYQAGIDSLQQLPKIAGEVVPLFQELGVSTDGVVAKLYTLGPAAQSSFQQLIEPLIQAQQVTKEYEATQLELLALEALKPKAIDNAEAQKIQEEIDLLKQKLALKLADYNVSKQYIASVQPNLQNTVSSFFSAQTKQQGRTVGGSPAQFSPPSILDINDYSVDQVRKALDETRDKQRDLIKLFPAYAKEFAKQQFLLQSGGGFKAVGGIDQSFFNQYLQQEKQKQAKPDIVDLSKYSDQKVVDILQRAAELQGKAVKLAPDLQQDADKSRLLILRKNNDLLAQNGLSQDFLRLAIDELTKSNEDVLRGHFNLPADYRAPTVFDYYAEGGKEKGSINYPRPGGDANLDLAQKIADAIISSQGKLPGQKGPDLGAIGPTIEPGSRPIGYPNPGTPGTYIAPPPLPISDQVTGGGGGTEKDYADFFTRHPSVDSTKSKAQEQAFDRNEKKLAAVDARLDGFDGSTRRVTDAQKAHFDVLSGLTTSYTNLKANIAKVADGLAAGVASQFSSKELSPVIRQAFLQGLDAIKVQITINGVQADPSKVTINTTSATGGGTQSLGSTSTTARTRPQ